VVDVGRPDERHALPGDREDTPLIAGVHEAHGLRDGDLRPGEHEVAAANLPELRRLAEDLSELVGPGPRRVDHRLGRDLGRPALAGAALVTQHDAAHVTARVSEQAHGAGVASRRAPAPYSLAQDPEREAGVVGLGVVVAVPAEHAGALEHREEPHDLGLVQALVVPLPRERVVHAEADAEHPARHGVAGERGERKGQALDETAALVEHPLTLFDALSCHEELTLAQVAQAPVNELRRAARGALGEVSSLDEQRAEPCARRLREDPRARDAPADDDEVPRGSELLPRVLAKTLAPHRRLVSRRGRPSPRRVTVYRAVSLGWKTLRRGRSIFAPKRVREGAHVATLWAPRANARSMRRVSAP